MMNLNIKTTPQTKKLIAKWSSELEQDIGAYNILDGDTGSVFSMKNYLYSSGYLMSIDNMIDEMELFYGRHQQR